MGTLVQLHRSAASDFLDGDQLRLGLHAGGDVVVALAQRDVVVGLFDLFIALDDQLELIVVLARLRRVGGLDGDRVAGGAALERLDHQARLALASGGQFGLGGRCAAGIVAIGATDADHIRRRLR